jgi:hypothetical protein
MIKSRQHGLPILAQVRRNYSGLLESKGERWRAQTRALVESIQDLAAFYGALRALPRSAPTADLGDWFGHLVEQVGRRLIWLVSLHAVRDQH